MSTTGPVLRASVAIWIPLLSPSRPARLSPLTVLRATVLLISGRAVQTAINVQHNVVTNFESSALPKRQTASRKAVSRSPQSSLLYLWYCWRSEASFRSFCSFTSEENGGLRKSEWNKSRRARPNRIYERPSSDSTSRSKAHQEFALCSPVARRH